jgi:hypothetical protein
MVASLIFPVAVAGGLAGFLVSCAKAFTESVIVARSTVADLMIVFIIFYLFVFIIVCLRIYCFLLIKQQTNCRKYNDRCSPDYIKPKKETISN